VTTWPTTVVSDFPTRRHFVRFRCTSYYYRFSNSGAHALLPVRVKRPIKMLGTFGYGRSACAKNVCLDRAMLRGPFADIYSFSMPKSKRYLQPFFICSFVLYQSISVYAPYRIKFVVCVFVWYINILFFFCFFFKPTKFFEWPN